MPAVSSKTYACTICPDTFDRIHLVKHHWSKAHKISDAQVCKACEIPFANKQLAQQHRRSAHDILCYLCGKGYENVDQLDDRIDNVHNTMLNYICRICGIKFRHNKLLIDHMKEHESWETLLGPLVFICEICGAKFLEESQLREHEMIHNRKWNAKTKNHKKSHDKNKKKSRRS